MKEIKFKSEKTSRPQVGDVFFGEVEFVIGRRKEGDENVIEVGLTKDQCIVKENKIETMVSKNKLFQFNRTVKKDVSIVDETRKNATFVVENVEFREELELIHSILPESYRVTARRLKDSKFDPEGEVIEFYTCGRFENTIEKSLEIIGEMN